MARRAALVVAVLCAAWTLRLVVAGGFDLNVAGWSITTNDPARPFLLACIAFFAWARASGMRPIADRSSAALDRIGDRRLAQAISLGIVIMGIAYASASGIASDGYGYVSQADLWLRWDPFVPEPDIEGAPWPDPHWTFAPLGYRPVLVNETWMLAPVYSAGLPMLMALAKLAGGQEALFWVVPMCGGLLTWLAFAIGRRAGSARAGLIASWLVATSPPVLWMLVQPMSDVPVAAAWVAAIFFALGSRPRDAALSGMASAIAILIRPNLAILALPLGWWWLWRRDNDGQPGHSPRRTITRALLYGTCTLPGIIATAVIYQTLYGSPTTSGYGDVNSMFSFSHVAQNVPRYFGWFTESQGLLACVGPAALLLPIRIVWPWVTNRRALWMILATLSLLVAEYLAYLVFDEWAYLRFLLTAWPFVMLGVAAVALLLARPHRPFATLAVAAAVVLLGLQGLHQSRTAGVFEIRDRHRLPVDVARGLAAEMPAASVIYSLHHSGSLRHYGGLTTVRMDLLAREWLDRSVNWLRAEGNQAFLLLEDWEVEPFKVRFAGQSLADTIDARLIVAYGANGQTRLYDLNGASRVTARVVPPGSPHELRAALPDPRAFDPRVARRSGR